MLPTEIVSFLKPDGRLLLLKGAAGTGKTLLAVELARTFQSQGRDVFWLASRHADPRENIDLEAIVPPQRTRDVRDGTGLEPGPSPGHGPAPPPDGGPAPSPGHVENVLHDLQHDIQDPGALIILDSLDGLWAGPQEHEVAAFTAAAKTVAQRIRASMVFIAESPGQHAADHLVDGIVELQQEVVGASLQRSCRLQKMRATQLVRPSYAFTLADGRFWAYVPQETEAPRPLRPSPRWGQMGSLSTGSNQWDLLLGGGLRQGSIHLVEYPRQAEAVADLLIKPLVLNALAAGWRVLYLAMPSRPGNHLADLIQPHMDPTWIPRLQILAPTTWHAPVAAARMTAAERLAPVERIRRKAGEERTLTVLNLEAMALQGGHEGLPGWLARWTSETRNRGGIDFIEAPAERVSAFSALADDAWQVRRHLDAPIVEGITPRTEPHFIRPQDHKGYPEVLLHPIH